MITIILKDKCYMFNMKDYHQELDFICTISAMKRDGKSSRVKVEIKETEERGIQTYGIIPTSVIDIKLEYRRYQPEIGDEIENLLNNLPKMEKKNDKESEEE